MIWLMVNHSLSSLLCFEYHSADRILFTAQHVKSQVISQQLFSLWRVRSPHHRQSHYGCRALHILKKWQDLTDMEGLQAKKTTQSIPCGCWFFFFCLCLIWNSHLSVQKLLEVSVMAAWGIVSLNTQHQVVQEGFYLWLKMNKTSLPDQDILPGAREGLGWGQNGELHISASVMHHRSLGLTFPSTKKTVPCAVRLVVKELSLLSFLRDPVLWVKKSISFRVKF